MEKTFEQLAKLESGTVLEDYYDDGVRILILRGPAALCVYLGVPENHPLAGFSYDDVNVSCHGGLTFAGAGDGKWRPVGFYWYGWDYGHLGDLFFYDLNRPNISDNTDKGWTVSEVKKDLWNSVYDFKKLMNLAEKIKSSHPLPPQP